MQTAELAILYEPERGRPLTVARITDRQLLIAAARAAIAEAESRAEMLGDVDPVLGAVQREESARMGRVLRMVIPELRASEPSLELVGPASTERSDGRR